MTYDEIRHHDNDVNDRDISNSETTFIWGQDSCERPPATVHIQYDRSKIYFKNFRTHCSLFIT